MSLPILYTFRRCPYAIRARLALASAGLVCESREIALRHKPQALLAASPKGTVPVLVLPDGRVLEQSLDIMLHALRWRDPDGWLTPGSGTWADMLGLIEGLDQHFKPALDRCKYPDRYPLPQVRQARASAGAWLSAINTQLAGADYLFGSQPCLADMALCPFVRQFAAIDAAYWQAQPWPHLQAWLQRWLDSALFAQVMQRLPVWQEAP